MSAFRSSRAAVLELAARYKELVLQLESEKTSNTSRTPEEIEAAEKLLFKEMCEICLWGNATDLSLLTSLTYEDLQKLQGSKARQASEQKILVDDLPAAYDALKKAQRNAGNKDRRVDIVLDNAGFELFVDFILAGYLLSADLATTIVLHPKSFPWYISDVTPNDILILLNALADPQAFYQTPSEDDKYAGRTHEPLSEKEMDELAFLFERWSKLHQEGKIVIRPNSFWTQAHSYWRLPTIEPSLFEDLKESELVIFKGDLNYRKLTADVSLAPRGLGSMARFFFFSLTLILGRSCGTPPLPSPPLSVPWAATPTSASWPCAPARPTSSLVSRRAKMKSYERRRAAVAIAARDDGVGAANGRWCSSAMGRKKTTVLNMNTFFLGYKLPKEIGEVKRFRNFLSLQKDFLLRELFNVSVFLQV